MIATATVSDPGINLVIVYNPLDLSSRENALLVWQEDRPLSAYLDGLPTEDVRIPTRSGHPFRFDSGH
jgi:hypothetical protein